MAFITLSDDEVVALATVLDGITNEQAGSRLHDADELGDFIYARFLVTKAAEDVIHRSRSQRRARHAEANA
jgi:hypothetical protein